MNLSFTERLAKIEEDNHPKRAEIEEKLPYAVTLGPWKQAEKENKNRTLPRTPTLNADRALNKAEA